MSPDRVKSYCYDKLFECWQAMAEILALSHEELLFFVLRCVEAFFAVSEKHCLRIEEIVKQFRTTGCEEKRL